MTYKEPYTYNQLINKNLVDLGASRIACRTLRMAVVTNTLHADKRQGSKASIERAAQFSDAHR